MLWVAVPGHHVFNSLQGSPSAFSFHFIPKQWRETIRLVWNAGVVRSGCPLDSPLYGAAFMRHFGRPRFKDFLQ
jgi:hypothetical protein